MTFADLTAGSVVFIDANTFVYAFVRDPRYGTACQQLLQRIDNKEIQGVASSHVLTETAHRMMTHEASLLTGRPPSGMPNWLKRHPPEVQRLALYRQAIDELTMIGVQILPVGGPTISHAVDISRQFGLLTNDAVTVVVMQDNGLTNLASNDADFDRVAGITRFAPI
jgi:predicted nucleic acid-binding protein